MMMKDFALLVEKWNVYYSERGCKTTNECFDTENNALKYIIKRFSK